MVGLSCRDRPRDELAERPDEVGVGELATRMPFPIRALSVDNGWEFRAEGTP
jgi:hypothetical protein